MSPMPSRLVAVVASLALVSCSSIGTINGQRLDVGAAPHDADPAPHSAYPCEDFEFLCISAVGAIVGFAIAYSQPSKPLPPGVVAPARP
jgi:hypothetical protein